MKLECKRRRALATVTGLLLLSSGLVGCGGSAPTESREGASGWPGMGSQGLTPDPDRQRAVQELVRSVRPMVERKPVDVRTVRLPQGEVVKRAYLGESFSNVVVLRQNADGSSSVSCVDSAEQAESFLAGRTEGQ